MDSRSAAADQVWAEIQAKVAEFYRLYHADRSTRPGEDVLKYASRVFDERELINGVEAVLEFQLTGGHFEREFASGLKALLDRREVLLANSGSSANLIALTALCGQQRPDRLAPGDEVITPAATFPTTLAPIVQNQLVPVLVDCELGTYNLDPEQLAAAYSARTRAICVPHTLGNPADMIRIMDFARRHDLYVIEDACDALGSRLAGQYVGTFGHLATLSFYPAHHITTGEGGAVCTNDEALGRVARSVRDWGRSDMAEQSRLAALSDDELLFDPQYRYVEIGYNLKLTEMQAAIGLAQLSKLAEFNRLRQQRFEWLYTHLRRYEEALLLPQWLPNAEPAWFAFPITVRPEAGFTRGQLVRHLEAHRIETRFLFAGNILNQPGYRPINRRVIGDLPNAEVVARGTFFIGVYPGLTEAHMSYMLEKFDRFFMELKQA
ncbi:MAG: lipopolysaccharide biosynthesis protein RfbH [Chloroflexi bacterium]|nr:lipopolysaccharide biosynthesis protein RfbH [Chloroflexota bacterium]